MAEQRPTGRRAVPGPSNRKGTRYRYIDMLKGFGMFLVMADHSGLPLCPVFDYLEVPVFFLASGFLFSFTPFEVFLRKKALRILVPYLVYDFLYILMCVLIGHEPFSAMRFVRMMLSPANYPLWFLRSLFWALLLTWLLYRLSHRPTGRRTNEAARRPTGGRAVPGPLFRRTNEAARRPTGRRAVPGPLFRRTNEAARRPTGGRAVPGPSHLLALVIAMVIGVGASHFCRGHQLQLMTGVPQAVTAMPLLIAGYWLRQWLGGISPRQQKSRIAAAAVVLIIAAVVLVHGHIAFHACNIGDRPWLFYPMSFLSCLAFLALFMTLDAYAPSTVAPGADAPSMGLTFYLLPFTFLMYVGRQSLVYFCLHAMVIYTLRVYGMVTPWHILIATVAITSALVYLLHGIPALRKVGLA